MHKKFDHQEIEKKWQETWKKDGLYDVGDRDDSKEKEYVLVEWPYPSGNLHIGHWFAFAVVDIFARAHRMQGKQVLFPMGFDAFGLPAENAAIKNNTNPKVWTESNIEYMKGQLSAMGNSFSWDKTTSSTDPEYYKWTQWMFTKFFENDIAFRGTGMVNWCPSCNTVLANEQVIADACERCGDVVEKKEMEEWKLRITQFADALIDDLDDLEWPEYIKEAQRQWIGRSAGAEIPFTLSIGEELKVFTTRPDTLFGATYMVMAPEHELVAAHKDEITNWDEVAAYIKTSQKKSEQDRLDATKEKTGVKLEGITATNPANGDELPVYIADYVLAGYGTGAIMAVPAHDGRDFAFAEKYGIQIKHVVTNIPENVKAAGAVLINKKGEVLLQKRTLDAPTSPGLIGPFGDVREEGETVLECLARELQEELELDIQTNGSAPRLWYQTPSKSQPEKVNAIFLITDVDDGALVLHEGESIFKLDSIEHLETLNPEERSNTFKQCMLSQLNELHTTPGTLINSGDFDGMDSEEAKIAITEKVGGKMTNTYRLRDWSIGRQRYWGVPIPIAYDPEGNPHAIPEEHLPWKLPEDVDFTPTGEPPLAKSAELKERVEKIFGEGWTPAVETMDTFVDSSWYFLRYIDNKNDDSLSSKEVQKDWMQIDYYFGGSEHTTMHVLYSRFWQKALYSLGLVEHNEPYKRRLNRGLVLGPDGNKMSKSKGNVIDPDEQVRNLGADTVKMYLAFMGPYGEPGNYPWDLDGITGLKRFLERVYGLSEHITDTEPEEITKQLHKTIAKVSSDIEDLKFNTAISTMMVFVNTVEKQSLTKETYTTFLKLLSAFAPHLTEELWHEAGNSTSIHLEAWPEADESLTKDDVVTVGVQVNGKIRGTVDIAPDATEDEAMAVVKNDAGLAARLEGEVVKVIYVPGRIINIMQK